jgi:hypothetical protein
MDVSESVDSAGGRSSGCCETADFRGDEGAGLGESDPFTVRRRSSYVDMPVAQHAHNSERPKTKVERQPSLTCFLWWVSSPLGCTSKMAARGGARPSIVATGGADHKTEGNSPVQVQDVRGVAVSCELCRR